MVGKTDTETNEQRIITENYANKNVEKSLITIIVIIVKAII